MSVTKYHALLVSDKPSLDHAIGIYLKKAGVPSYSTARSMREVVRKATLELPHLFIFLDDLPDAPALQILEHLRSNPLFGETIMLVMRKCTQNEALQFMKLRTAAIIAQGADPNILIDKIKTSLAGLRGMSTYSIRGEELNGGSLLTVLAPATIIGRHEDHVVCRSSLDAGNGTQVSVIPEKPILEPFAARFTSSANAMRENARENLFNLCEVTGRGRKWVEQILPPLDHALSADKKHLLVYERDAVRRNLLQKMLALHNIETKCTDSLGELTTFFRNNPLDCGAAFFCESLVGANAIPWERAKQQFSEELRPIEIIATAVSRPSPAPNTIWLQKPFGLDQIARAFRAAVASRHGKVDSQSVSTHQVPANYALQANLVALDEAGGVLRARVVPLEGTELRLDHPFLNRMRIFSRVRVTSAAPHDTNPDLSLVRFQIMDSGFTKDKFYAHLRESVFGGGSQNSAGNCNTNDHGSLPANPRVVSKPVWQEQRDIMPKFKVNDSK